MDPWFLTIPNVTINVSYPCTVIVEITPCEYVLIKTSMLKEAELIDAYRQGIERGSIRHYRIIG